MSNGIVNSIHLNKTGLLRAVLSSSTLFGQKDLSLGTSSPMHFTESTAVFHVTSKKYRWMDDLFFLQPIQLIQL